MGRKVVGAQILVVECEVGGRGGECESESCRLAEEVEGVVVAVVVVVVLVETVVVEQKNGGVGR